MYKNWRKNMKVKEKVKVKSGVICPQCRESIIDLQVLQCSSCSWKGEFVDGIPVLLSTRTKTDPLLNRYIQIYDQIASDDIEESIMEVEYVRMLAERTAKIVGENLTGQFGCDVGSGKGFLSDALIKRGADVTVIDIALPYLKQLKEKNENLECILANAEEMPFREQFDFITCADVMEHVLNVSNFLYCLNEALKPGGVAVVRVPYRENLLSYATHLECGYDLVHLRSYNEELLRDIMVGAGFEVDEISFGGFSLSMGLPRNCDDGSEHTKDVIKARKILQDRGITYDDLSDMPEWFVKQICRPFEITVKACKTHRIEKSKEAIYELVPVS